MIGRVLKGRYRILEIVGRGGVATVYLGRDVRDNRTVAVKVLKEEYTEHPEFSERFRREAETVLRLSNPRIVQFLDYGIEDGQHFLVMEYLEGKTLAEVLRERGPLPVEEAVDIAVQVCEALEVARQASVVHRDIKPQNLMLMPDGTVKVMDFGLARVATGVTLTQTGVFMGTPRYVCPEVVKGQRVDHRGDIYSLGVVLYEMLTGDIPFGTDSTWALLQAHVHDMPPPLRDMRPDVPKGLEKAVAIALAKNPDERFPTAAAFRAALQEGEARASAPLRRWLPLRPVAGAVLGVMLLLAAGAVWSTRGGGPLPGAQPVETTSPPAPERVGFLPTTPPSTFTPTPFSQMQEPTATYTPPPAPSPTPTATRQAQTGSTSSPPPSPTRTASPSPTHTATRTPTSTQTWTPRPTATPTLAQHAPPALVHPTEGVTWRWSHLDFTWAWEESLGSEEFFELRVFPMGGGPDQPLFRAWSRDQALDVNLTGLPPGAYAWAVWVVRGQATAEGVAVTGIVASPTDFWTFGWDPSSPLSPTPTSPRPQPTPTPTKQPTNTPEPTKRPTRTPTPAPPTNTPTPRPTATPRLTAIPITPPPQSTPTAPPAAR
ncbi:MAG: serine/threonine-protein kinase [Anaerolineae bacterium]